MRFSKPLIPATLQRRYKRFLADVTLADGTETTVHCPNPGAMLGLDAPGSPIMLSRSDNPKRKLPLTLELMHADGTWVGINTNLPNRLAEEAIAGGTIPELHGFESLRREVRYGENSRIDILLEQPNGEPETYVEVKNVHLRRPDRFDGHAAEFPDCVTTRGAKHLRELSTMVASGHRAVMLFLVQRADCNHFRIAEDLDPGYAKAFGDALGSGVEAVCYACAVTPEGIKVERSIPVPV